MDKNNSIVEFIKSHVIGILILIILAPSSFMICRYYYYLSMEGSNVLGIGKQNVQADSAAMSIKLYFKDYKDVDPKIKKSILAILASNTISESSIKDNSSLSLLSLYIKNIKRDKFYIIDNIKSQMLNKYPDMNFDVNYYYTLTDNIKTSLLYAGTADARAQGQHLAEINHKDVSLFNGAICNYVIINADESFNPSTCSSASMTYDDSSPEKTVYGMVSANVYFSRF